MKKKNCWKVMKCCRERGGKNEKLDICPAAKSNEFNGVNNGELGGRFCWSLAGTFCKGELQGSIAKKIENCFECAFLIMSWKKRGEILY